MNQSELEANTCNRRQARENACEQVTIGLTSDCLRKWLDFFFKLIGEQTRITQFTQLKTAVSKLRPRSDLAPVTGARARVPV